MIILVGASATGKTEVAKEIIKTYNFTKFVTTTTRKMRDGEVNNVDYHFISNEEFENKIGNNRFFEYVNYSGYYYGTCKDDAGDNKVLIVEINGANAIYSSSKDNSKIYYLESSEQIRKDRMIKRGDNIVSINARLENDRKAFNKELLNHIDLVIDSDSMSISDMAKLIFDHYSNN